MNFLLAADTDVGIRKHINQDSVLALRAETAQGPVVLAVLCDGMGGLERGEVASATAILAYREWFSKKFPSLLMSGLTDDAIRADWEFLIDDISGRLRTYGEENKVQLGTTLTALLLCQDRYYIVNVGDTRAYRLAGTIEQLTEDQTVVQDEVNRGNLTPEQAETDTRRNVLLQCIGASDYVYPVFTFGTPQPDEVYLLCCDGFRHEVKPNEMLAQLGPQAVSDQAAMGRAARSLIDLNMERQERDNISVIVLRTL